MRILVTLLLVIGGVGLMWSSISQIAKALKTGTFFGFMGQPYRESRREGPIGFWANMTFRALLFPGGIWMIYYAATHLPRFS